MLVGEFSSIIDININSVPLTSLLLFLRAPRISVTHFCVARGALGRPCLVHSRGIRRQGLHVYTLPHDCSFLRSQFAKKTYNHTSFTASGRPDVQPLNSFPEFQYSHRTSSCFGDRTFAAVEQECGTVCRLTYEKQSCHTHGSGGR